MSSGLEWDENLPIYEDQTTVKWPYFARATVGVLPCFQRVVSTPGSEWNYGGCSELLGATVVRKASGKPIEEFANETLFSQRYLGRWVGAISRPEITGCRQWPATATRDFTKNWSDAMQNWLPLLISRFMLVCFRAAGTLAWRVQDARKPEAL